MDRRDRGPGAATTSAWRALLDELGDGVEAMDVSRTDDGALGDAARRAGVRLRRVALEASWWTHEGGPLVGLHREHGTPVALLWRHGGYRRVEAGGHEQPVVGADEASELEPYAFVVHPRLPSQPLGGGEVLRLAWDSARADARTLLALPLLAGLVVLVLPLVAWLAASAVEGSGSGQELALAAALLLLVGGGVSVAMYLRTRVGLRIGVRFDALAGPALWDRMLRLPGSFHRGFDAGDLARRTRALEPLRDIAIDLLVAVLTGVVTVALGLIVLVLIEAALALVGVVVAVVGMAAFALVAGRQVRASRDAFAEDGKAAALTASLVVGVPTLRAAGAERHALATWAGQAQRQQAATIHARRTSWSAEVVVTIVAWLAIVLAALVVAGANDAATRTPPIVAAGVVGLGSIVWATARVGLALVAAAAMLPTAERVRPILEAVPPRDPSDDDRTVPAGRPLEASDVTFSYGEGNAPAVADISLRVEPGSLLAIVGPSGAGKTTLLRLLLGLERATRGVITYDGRALSDFEHDGWWRGISVAFEGATLFASDIRSNVAPARGAADEDVWKALAVVGLESDVRAMPMGLATFVAEGGQALSRGQRQRILLARALVRPSPMLFLDDTLAELDGPTRRGLSRHLAGLEATRVVVSQEPELLLAADEVVVVEGGRITQRGAPDELASVDGYFRELLRYALV